MVKYIPTEWKDEIVDGAGNVVQKGTPLSAANLKKLEAGVEGAVAGVVGKVDGAVFEQFKSATTTQLAETAYYNKGKMSGNIPHTAKVLGVPTYDSSGQGVHPDVVYIDSGFGSKLWKYWMAFTPYTGGNDKTENPSILASHDGVDWVVPDGLVNPIVPLPSIPNSHNSDTDMVYFSNKLYMYYRETVKTEPRSHKIYLKTSTDGVVWSAPIEILSDTSGRSDALLSPAIVIDGAVWYMWIVDGWGNLVRKSSTDGISWSNNTDTTTTGMPTNRRHWHVDVIKTGNIYEALFHTSTATGGTDSRLHYGYSSDGLNWITSEPFIDRLYDFERSLHYRGTMLKTKEFDNLYDIWYSSRSSGGLWSIAYIRAVKIDNRLIPIYPTDHRNFKITNLAQQDIKKLITEEISKEDGADLQGKSGTASLTSSSPTQEIPNNPTLATLQMVHINFPFVLFDDAKFFNVAEPHKATLPFGVRRARITAGIILSLNDVGARRVEITKNGAQVVAGARYLGVGNSEVTICSPVLANLKEGDYFGVRIAQNSGEIITVLKSINTFISIEIIQ